MLVTMDKDFGELIFAHGVQHGGLVRLPDVPAASRIALMREVLQKHGNDLADGAPLSRFAADVCEYLVPDTFLTGVRQ